MKYYEDNRYDKNKIVTHDNYSLDAINCNYLQDINDKINKFDVICIDEIQFFNDAYIYCNKWQIKIRLLK